MLDPAQPWGFPVEAVATRAARGLGPSDRILWTPGGTSALALAIQDLKWAPNDVVLTSSMEHIAVERPLLHLEPRGVGIVRIPRASDGPLDLDALRDALAQQGPVRALVVTAAANTTGERLPIREAASMAAAAGAAVLVDGAQTAGWGDDPVGIDAPCEDVDAVAFTGHKALQGLWGIGGLLTRPSDRLAFRSPRFDPDRAPPAPSYCDAGSVDPIALQALAAAAMHRAQDGDRLARCTAWADRLHRVLCELPKVRCLNRRRSTDLPTLCFRVLGETPQRTASRLKGLGLLVAAGEQCAPSAYAALGSRDGGVRLSLGAATTADEVEIVERILVEALG